MGRSVYLFSDQNGAKTLPDGVAHTYMAYIREYPPPGLQNTWLVTSFTSRWIRKAHSASDIFGLTSKKLNRMLNFGFIEIA